MLTEPGGKPAFKKLAAYNSIVLNKSNQTCLDYGYDNMIKEMRNISWGSEGGMLWSIVLKTINNHYVYLQAHSLVICLNKYSVTNIKNIY